jgi:hypothetical protein
MSRSGCQKPDREGGLLVKVAVDRGHPCPPACAARSAHAVLLKLVSRFALRRTGRAPQRGCPAGDPAMSALHLV